MCQRITKCVAKRENIKKHVIYTCFRRILAAIRWIVRIRYKSLNASSWQHHTFTAEFRCSRYVCHYMVFFPLFSCSNIPNFFSFNATIETEFFLWHVPTASAPSWVLPAFTFPLALNFFPSFIYGYVLQFILIFASSACFYFDIHHLHLACDYEYYLFFLPFAVRWFCVKCRSASDKSKIEFATFRHGRVSVIIYYYYYYSMRVVYFSRREIDGAKKLKYSFVPEFHIGMLKDTPRNWYYGWAFHSVSIFDSHFWDLKETHRRS